MATASTNLTAPSAAFYCICADGYVYQPQNQSNLPTILYHIETSFYKSTPNSVRYTSYVQDQTRQRVPGNILEWNGIKCRLEEHDGWSIDSEEKKEFGIDGTVLIAHITDTKGKVRRMLFDNRVKNGQAWKDLMEYVRDLHGVGTHRTVALARQRR